MVAIKSVAHFSIPVSDIARSTAFYTEIVGCRHLETVGRGTMSFLDAAGTCLILVKRDPPINPVAEIGATRPLCGRPRATRNSRVGNCLHHADEERDQGGCDHGA